ncbi:hypothetical protein KFL_003140140 [Klebsormidium nitens]|uniref:Uncharacterized protein n=1 Tax=Klebsormidium nitens TaxID=105231 RepID=A0A1Y1I7A2_KLENI|nr:hypothetical protein KFL_003140140 [Klebsormidium nitens]|eukprot:GAQ86835.1 hypothetical protein KFL_003140140 [Klebsormidium nitens]
MSGFGGQEGAERRILEELVRKAGPENLIGLRLYGTLTLDGSRLYEVRSYDQESQRFQVRDVLSGREPTATGFLLTEFEIGLATRNPDDPILQLLENHGLPTTRFITGQRARGKFASSGARAESPGKPSQGEASAQSLLLFLLVGLPGRDPEQAPQTGREVSGRRRPAGITTRLAIQPVRTPGRSRSLSRRALVAHVEDLMRDRRASGIQAELRRFQAAIPPEKRDLNAQFDMAATIQSAPSTWGPSLALAICLGTVLKAINMSLTFLADAIFTFARQKCEDAGRDLTEKKQARIDSEIWEFYRKQRGEGPRR